MKQEQRMVNAIGGIESLKESVDTLIVIPNDKLLEIVDRQNYNAGCIEEGR